MSADALAKDAAEARFTGRIVVDGASDAPALVPEQPINITAAMCKVPNMVSSKRAEVRDAHLELYKQNVAGMTLVFIRCIGFVHPGLLLLDLVSLDRSPAALIVQNFYSLLISGVMFSEGWFDKAVPIIEHPHADLFDHVANGDCGRIARETGVVEVFDD